MVSLFLQTTQQDINFFLATLSVKPSTLANLLSTYSMLALPKPLESTSHIWYLSSFYFFLHCCSHLILIPLALAIFERIVRVVSVGLWSVRRIFLILPRMKCRCPYSASAMIGHAHSVERLYPHWGKHELQSSHL